jgi:chloramphenicol 3-O-phosphotransferase
MQLMTTQSNRFVLQKAKKPEPAKAPVEDADGVLTRAGMDVAHQYALQWRTKQTRNVQLEAQYPELIGLFYDIRNDAELAAEHAIPFQKGFTVMGDDPRTVLVSRKSAFQKSDTRNGAAFQKKECEVFYIPMGEQERSTALVVPLVKANLGISAHSGPFMGPRGGRYSDPQLTIPWKDVKEPKGKSTQEPQKRDWVDHFKGKPYQTSEEYRTGEQKNGLPIYKKERQAVHREVQKQFLRTSEGREIKKPPPHEQKVAIVMMGGPASGKTSVVKGSLGISPDRTFADAGFVNVNPDDCKELLPEYNAALNMPGGKSAKDAAFMVHNESSDIADQILNIGIDQGLNLVVDGTGKNYRKHVEKIERLKAAGYHVKLVMPDVDMEEARKRSSDRAEATGRWVPQGPPPKDNPDIIGEAYPKIQKNFESIARVADEFQMWDTRGRPPSLKWQGGAGQPDVIKDPTFVEGFRRRAQKAEAEMSKADRTEPFQKATKTQDGDEKKPAITAEQMEANMKKYGVKLLEHEEKQPKRFAKNEGCTAVVEDSEFSFLPKGRIKYQ